MEKVPKLGGSREYFHSRKANLFLFIVELIFAYLKGITFVMFYTIAIRTNRFFVLF